MRTCSKYSLATCLASFVLTGAHSTPLMPGGGEACRAAQQAEKAAAAKAATPAAPQSIELVICLDTSGSMSGLIDAARAKIWDIVSDLATAKPQPKLRVALLTFGNDGLNPENGWTNVETDLTEDLDSVSQKLFALSTNGGTELVGRVIAKATNSLHWNSDSLKILVVAGNEFAHQ
jgi:Mg-chelatase subunit ChlD